MRRLLMSATAPGRWRRRRAARIALAVTLVVAAPFTGRPSADVPAGAPPAGEQHAADHSRIRVVPVPLADPAVADLLTPGDLVDLVGTAAPDTSDAPDPFTYPGSDAEDSLPPEPTVVAHAVRVRDTPTGRSGNRSILVEVAEPDAARLAAIAAGTPLAVLVHG